MSLLRTVIVAVAISAAACSASTAITYSLYDGTSSSDLGFTMSNWGWGYNAASTSCKPSGYTYAMSLNKLWDGELVLRGSWGMAVGDVTSVDLWVSGGTTGSQTVTLEMQTFGTTIGAVVSLSDLGVTLTADCTTFTHVSIPIAKFISNGSPVSSHVPGGLVIKNTGDGAIYISKLQIIGVGHSAGSVSVSVDTTSSYNSRTFLSELLGVNFANSTHIKANGYTNNRWGGNAMSTYAYELDAESHAADWYFEVLPNAVSDVSKLPNGSSSDVFLQNTIDGGARTVFTLPTIGWVAKSRDTCCSYDKTTFPSQTGFDTWNPQCGTGISSTTYKNLAGANASKCFKKADAAYAIKFMDHLIGNFGSSLASDALWLLDNEPNYWHTTHSDVHESPVTYDELWENSKTYSLAIKAAYPNAQIGAPDLAGVCALFSSAYDVNQSCVVAGSDQTAHSGLTLLEWYIKQVGDYYTANNVKLIDYFDVHTYPEQVYTVDSSQILKTVLSTRSVRELWDESYASAAWHGRYTGVLRWIQNNITKYAPWMKISVTEYSWSLASSDTTLGAVCDAEAIAVFAREGVHLASRWVVPDLNTKTEYSFRMYNGYAGPHRMIGARVLNITSPDLEAVTIYGFASSSYVWILLFNKQPYDTLSVTVSLTGSTYASSGDVFTLDASHNAAKTGTVTVSGSAFTVSLPVLSAVIVEVPLSGTDTASSTATPIPESSVTAVTESSASPSASCSLSSALPTGATGFGTCSTSVSSGTTCKYECSSAYTAVTGDCVSGSWSTEPSCEVNTGAAGALKIGALVLLSALAFF